MNKMSNGEDSTLGNHRKMAVAVFGEEGPAVKFLDKKIAESPNGANEEVLVAESQFVYLLGTLHFAGENKD
jgi:hypothetical protein